MTFLCCLNNYVDKKVLSIDLENTKGERISFVSAALFLRDIVGLKADEIVGLKKAKFFGNKAMLQISMFNEVHVNDRFKHNNGVLRRII